MQSALLVELTIDDRRQDMILEGIEVAISFGKLPDSSAIARLIGRWPLVIGAAPAYLDALGTPETPDELADHAFVIAGPVAGKELLFQQGERQVKVQPKGQVVIARIWITETSCNCCLIGSWLTSRRTRSSALDKLLNLLPEP